MSLYLSIAIIALIFVVIFQIAKASEYVSILKGEENSRKQNNKINGFLMFAFLVLGFIGVYVCNEYLFDKTLLAQPAASVQGEKLDQMLWITLAITGAVFIATQFLLFWFAYKYQEDENRKVFFFAHSTKLELIWTAIPAITLTVLVVFGLRNWFFFTGDAPKNAMVVEVTGKQFGWIFRYSGKDAVFGKKYYKNIDPATNSVGIIWDDKYAQDDILTEQTMYVVKGQPVKLIIGSRDVIHDVGLSHFRLKMDAVPGIPTTMWFTPLYTTKEMREKTGNPNFAYEISCDQMCGNGHYSMKGIVEVVEQDEYDLWMAKQKAQYLVAFPEKDPEAAKAADAEGKVNAAATEAAKAPGAKKDSTAKKATAKM
jgi:cytochrome c oxidase subunit 2